MDVAMDIDHVLNVGPGARKLNCWTARSLGNPEAIGQTHRPIHHRSSVQGLRLICIVSYTKTNVSPQAVIFISFFTY